MRSGFKDDDDIRRQMRSFDFRSNYLVRNFSRCSVNIKSLMFSAYCGSLYCAPSRVTLKCSYISTICKLTVSYTNAFRRLIYLSRRCSASGMFVSNGVSSFGELWCRSTYSFRERVYKCNNCRVHCVYITVYYTSTCHRRWETTLYT